MINDLSSRYRAFIKAPTPEYLAVKRHWRGFKHTVCINGKWRIEGFITWFTKEYELLRCVDPSLPSALSPDLYKPETIARMFGIPPAELGCPEKGKPGRPSTMEDVAKFAFDRRPNVRWKEIVSEWKQQNPQDSRKVTEAKMKDAYRRKYLGKGR